MALVCETVWNCISEGFIVVILSRGMEREVSESVSIRFVWRIGEHLVCLERVLEAGSAGSSLGGVE